ncbi:MAG: hypothetical protein RLZ09_2173, partial [Pseudomonadota bacterium]
MSKPSPLLRRSSSESLVESSSHETPVAKEQTESPPSPVMKTKTKKDDQQEVYKANESTNTIAIAIANANANESSTSSAIVTKKNNDGEKNFKTEIDTAQKLSAEKEKWEKFSKKINRFGVLKLENLNSEAIQNIAEWLNTSPSGKLMGLEIHW